MNKLDISLYLKWIERNQKKAQIQSILKFDKYQMFQRMH